jgi:hypothetical protein
MDITDGGELFGIWDPQGGPDHLGRWLRAACGDSEFQGISRLLVFDDRDEADAACARLYRIAAAIGDSPRPIASDEDQALPLHSIRRRGGDDAAPTPFADPIRVQTSIRPNFAAGS